MGAVDPGKAFAAWASMGVLLLALAGCGSGGDYDSFIDRYSQAACHRVFTCCRPADLSVVHQPADEATCASTTSARARKEVADLMRYGLVSYDAEAGQRCLSLLASATCGQLFDREYGQLVGCPNFFPGTAPLGAPCDDDFTCASEWCVSQSCQPRPCAGGCPAGQACDDDKGCIPITPLGAACSSLEGTCGPDAACLDQHCAPRRADGDMCKSADECAGTCDAKPSLPPATGMCRPGLCQGL